jgi:hypothetical protein
MFYVGLDLGQRHDPTAIAVVEKITNHVRVVGGELRAGGRRHRSGCAGGGYAARGEARLRYRGGDDYGRGTADSEGIGVECAEAGSDCRCAVDVERGELRLAKGLRELGPLMRELTDVRSTAGIGGRVRLGADGCGEHDDLVIALALACWGAKRGQIGFGAGRLPGI